MPACTIEQFSVFYLEIRLYNFKMPVCLTNMGLLRVKSTPAAILLSFTAIVSLIYALNFMFFADCYVTGGADCFTILSNGTIDGDNSFGNGAPETAFNGVLMFGIFISTGIILNEGAKGKWSTMIPVIIGLTTMTAVLWLYWGDDLDSAETPKYVTPILLFAYTAAYFLLKREDEVDDGLSDFSPGQNIKDTPALITLSLVALMGGYYCFRALLSPGAVSDLVEPGALEHGLGSPSNVTVAVGGSLFLVYFLWTVLTILDGASGKWAIIHPGIFALLAGAIQNYVGYASEEARRAITDATIQDAVAGPLALLLVLFSYYRLRPEGIEDGMTYAGEDWPNKANDFNVMVIGFALVLGLLFTLNAVLG